MLFTMSFDGESFFVSLSLLSVDTCVSASSIFIASISVTAITASSKADLNLDAFSAFAKRIANTSVFVSSSKTKKKTKILLKISSKKNGLNP